MPTNRRRRAVHRRRDVRELTFSALYQLATGYSMLSPELRTREDLEAAWEAHAEDIMSVWLELFPGWRPLAWWVCEGVPRYGERLVTDEAPDASAWAEACRQDDGRQQTFGVLHTHLLPPLQESERTYLERHGLLEPAEAEALARGEGHCPFGSGPGMSGLWERLNEEGPETEGL